MFYKKLTFMHAHVQLTLKTYLTMLHCAPLILSNACKAKETHLCALVQVGERIPPLSRSLIDQSIERVEI